MSGLVIDDAGFEVRAGASRIGPRRLLGTADVALLTSLAARYARAVHAGSGRDVFVALGRELSAWLEGDEGQLTNLLAQADAPFVFEIQGPRIPTDAAWALLRAPFELLSRRSGEFLAADALSRWCVVRRLGVAAAPPPRDEYRFGLAFMASSPRDQRELDYEGEEAAILAAVGETSLDLLVEDTGDPEQLAGRLAEVGGMPAVHLSCHGLNNWQFTAGAPGVPVLLMEDDAGIGRPTTAADLVSLLTRKPRLLFVSACLTATGADASGDTPARFLPPPAGRKAEQDEQARDGKGGDGSGAGRLVAHSLATALVTAGLPAVLGWDGSVGDRAATFFAQRLYKALARGADLAVAVGDARRALLDSDDPGLSSDWHLARLWLGPSGGGPLVGGRTRRSLVPPNQGTKIFLAGKTQVPVAAPAMFVGRRPQLQRALRALRGDDWAGVLLRGQGRLGKSSLAARITDRLPDYAPAVVVGDYTALGILDAIAAAVRTNPAARDLIETRRPEVSQRPETLETVLLDLLAGPCAQSGPDGKRPLLLIIDDLERILVADPSGPHRVNPGHAPVLAAVLRAFNPAETQSRLLLTSRFTVSLNGLENRLEDVQLPPLSDVAQDKLHRRQRALAGQGPQDEVSDLAARAVAVSSGNPGLQDLIVLRLVYGKDVSRARAEAAVAGMEAYLSQGDLPADSDVRAFLETLALATLLDEAGGPNVALLRAATLFTLPVPEPVLNALAAEVHGSTGRLRGLGLLDPYPDLYDPSRLALAANSLAVGRIAPLTKAEQTAFAAMSTLALFDAWGAQAPRFYRDSSLDVQLTRLALMAENPAVAASCAGGAVAALLEGHAAEAFRFGKDAIALLDRHAIPAPLYLLRQAANAAFTAGHGEAGEALLDRAVELSRAGDTQDEEPLEHARIIVEQARRLVTRGELSKAETLLRQADQFFTAAGSEHEAAVTWGQIGDIAYRRGELDEALRIRREVQLPVFERLGDVRSAAVTWGKIADVAYDRGELDEALRIRREVQLPVYERLGDVDGIALVTWDLARIDLAREDYESARQRLSESFQICLQLQRTDGIAVVGQTLGEQLLAFGETDQAREVLTMALSAAAKLGWADNAHQITELLERADGPGRSDP